MTLSLRRILSVVLSAVLATAITVLPVAADMPVATVELSSIDDIAAGAGSLCGALAMQGMDQMLVPMLGGALHSPTLAGVDRTKPILMHVFIPEQEKGAMGPLSFTPSFAFVIPVLDGGQTYVSSLKQMSPESTEKDGVLNFAGIQPAIPVAQDGLFVATANGCAVVGDSQKTVAMVAKAVTKSPTALSSVLKVPGAIRVGLNIPACIAPVEAGLQMAIATMQMQEMPSEMGMDPVVILKAEADALLGIMRQINGFTFSVLPRKRTLDIYSRVDPLPNTVLARMITGLKPASARYRSMLSDRAYLASAGTGMDLLQEIAEPYCNLLEEIYAGMGDQFKEMGPMVRKAMTEMGDLYSGDYVIGLIPSATPPGIGFVEVFGVKDAAKLQAVSEEMMDLYSDGIMGMKIEKGQGRTYKGLAITPYSYAFDAAAAAGTPAAPGMPGMPTFLNGLKMEVAYTDRDVIYTVGNPDVMDSAIDSYLSGETAIEARKSFKTLVPTLKHKPVQLYSFSLVRMARDLLASTLTPEQLAMIPANTHGLAGYSMVSGDNFIDIDRIGLTEIAAIKQVVPLLQNVFMQLMMGGMMAPTPPPMQ